MEKVVLITQSNYLPWVGFFCLLNHCDEFVILDDVQFTRRDWRNRNLIKSNNSTKWITIPLEQKGTFGKARVMDMKVANSRWCTQHYSALTEYYKRSSFSADIFEKLKPIFNKAKNLKFLSDINFLFVSEIAKLLGIDCKISYSTEYIPLASLDSFSASERLFKLTLKSSSTVYLTGPAAKKYINQKLFEKNGVRIAFANYEKLKPYKQFGEQFTSKVSIVDTLFHLGISGCKDYIASVDLYNK